MANHEERRTYTPAHVANYFLEHSLREQSPLTVLKLMKLCYFGYGWYAGFYGDELFDEPIEAWSYGPVIPSLYHEFKHYGRLPIVEKATTLEIRDRDRGCTKAGYELDQPSIPEDHAQVRVILGWVWETYSPFGAFALSNLTHRPGTPWREVFVKGAGDAVKYKRIDPQLIRTHFEKLLEKYGRG